MTLRVRGIYATAVTDLFTDEVVQASPPIRDRFDAEFPVAPADVDVTTTEDRQGVGASGDPEAVERVASRLASVSIDTLAWQDPAPLGAVFDATVTETLGSGAVLGLGDREGFLRFGETDDRVDTGDTYRVQVTTPRAPWADARPGLSTDIEVPGALVTLVRGGSTGTHNQPELVDLLSTDPPGGWGVRWGRDADDAGFEELDDELATAREAAIDIEAELAAEQGESPRSLWDGLATTWIWFGREGRFALDDRRREVATTMPGHHRVKAGDETASAAVDFAEALCGPDGDDAFPFEVVARQFGPRPGDTVAIDHGKPAGHCITLGRATVEDVEGDGTVTLEREMSPGGTYDALGVEREAGDVAVTKVREGRWWYPTVYRSADGDRRGTYVNVCTPVEVFPDAVRYVDLHVDVVKHADGTVERVDDDELDAAVEDGNVGEALAEKAREVADALERAL
jgi:hypothetical protein